MVEADRTEHGRIGIDQIGRIEPPAQTHLEHREAHVRLSEQPQRGERVVFEEGEGFRAPGRFDVFECAHQRRIVDFATLDADALVVAEEMGRGEQPDGGPGSEQQRLGVRRRRALAIGTGHGDHVRRGPIEPEPARHGADPREAQIDAVRMGRLLARQPILE